MPRSFFALVPLLAGLAAPAGASTLPDAGLERGQVAVTAGLADLSADWAATDRLQVGAGGYFTLVGAGTYGRLTYQVLADSPVGDVGLHLAGGAYSPVFMKLDSGLFVFAGPVVAKAIGPVTVRASLGLIATNSHNVVRGPNPGSLIPLAAPIVSRSWGLGIDDLLGTPQTSAIPYWGPFVPNLEVAFRLAPNHELTLGGNALVGWRGRFGGT